MAKNQPKEVNGYALSRQWFDFAFENPHLINVNQGMLYNWLIELNNRRGFAEKFSFNTEDACGFTGIKNRKTIWEALNKLVDFGFVTMVYKSQTPGKATVLSIINNVVPSNGCLDKSLMMSAKRTPTVTQDKPDTDTIVNAERTPTVTQDGQSYKQVNKETNNQLNKIVEVEAREAEIETDIVNFFENENPEKEKSSAKKEIPGLTEIETEVSQTAHWRNVSEHHKFSQNERQDLFQKFYETKEDEYRIRMPPILDIAKNFYFWSEIQKNKTATKKTPPNGTKYPNSADTRNAKVASVANLKALAEDFLRNATIEIDPG